ncbi:MAG: 7TM-DISM domain-containing protein, partial [Pseudomonadota bacterium]
MRIINDLAVWLSAFIIFCTQIASADSIIIDDSTNKIHILDQTYYLVEEKPLSFEDILKDTTNSLFKPTKTLDSRGFGYPDNGLWINFSLFYQSSPINQESNNRKMLLEVNFALITQAILFYKDKNNEWTSKEVSLNNPFNQREIAYRNPVFT